MKRVPILGLGPLAICLLALVGAAPAPNYGHDNKEKFKEVREETIPADRHIIMVDGNKNGGISVHGWEKDEILVRTKITAWAHSTDEAKELAREIQVHYGEQIHAEGPGSRWSASFEIFVPYRSNLELNTHNGGIGITEIHGDISFKALNGGVGLTDVGGDVQGRTTNGGLSIKLSGDQWDGEGLDVKTTNGGLVIDLPEDYSAHLETGTVNGGIEIDFPIMVQGRIGKKLSTDIGDGGTTISAKTTNGHVVIRKHRAE